MSVGYEARKKVHKCCPARALKFLPQRLLQPATGPARLHGVIGQTSMYVGQWEDGNQRKGIRRMGSGGLASNDGTDV
jgi:hypothetical protein